MPKLLMFLFLVGCTSTEYLKRDSDSKDLRDVSLYKGLIVSKNGKESKGSDISIGPKTIEYFDLQGTKRSVERDSVLSIRIVNHRGSVILGIVCGSLIGFAIGYERSSQMKHEDLDFSQLNALFGPIAAGFGLGALLGLVLPMTDEYILLK